MKVPLSQLYKNFDLSVDRVRNLSKNFCHPLGITVFGYVRIHDNGIISWVTSNPDQDRFLVESDALTKNPLVSDRNLLKEGCYLDLYNRQFPGSEEFYCERAKRFQMDHGMVLVRHQKDYIETCCFSGLAAKKELFQLFMNEQGLFRSFMEHFTSQLSEARLVEMLSQGISLADLKDAEESNESLLDFTADRAALIEVCGWKNLLRLSRREKQCLALLKERYTYQAIGDILGLSERTIEHYFISIKNKLNVESRSDLFLAAEKLVELKLLDVKFQKKR